MSVPLRKEEPEFEEDLTTADLAQGKRPVSEDRPKPVLAGRASEERADDRAFDENVQQNPQNISTRSISNDVRSAPERTAEATPLFPESELEGLRSRWSEVQTAFVDEPRNAVEKADGLVAAAMKRLAEVFAEERSKLEQQWDRGDNVSTEDLRIALQRYRSFFQRLLSV
jgi:hypothetical protein